MRVYGAVDLKGLTGAVQAGRWVGVTTSGPPTTGTFSKGDWTEARDGAMWVCITAGSPGTWQVVGGVLTGTFAELLTLGASAANKGMLYRVTDLRGGDSLWYSDGSTWAQVAPVTTAGDSASRSILAGAGGFAGDYETCPRYVANSAALAAGTTGQLRMVAIWLPINTTVTNISFLMGSTALSGGTHGWAALFDGSRNLLRQSANDTTPTPPSGAMENFVLTSPYVTTTTGLYYLGVMWVATIMPTLNGMNNSAVGNGVFPILGGTSTGSLTTTAPNPAAAITAIAGIPYANVS